MFYSNFYIFPNFFFTQLRFYFVNWSMAILAIDLWFLFTVKYCETVQTVHITQNFFDPTGILPNAYKTFFCGCFLKLCPIFVGPTSTRPHAISIHKIQQFPWSSYIVFVFEFKNLQPTWPYSTYHSKTFVWPHRDPSECLFCGCFLKLCPIFVGPMLSQFTKFSSFLEAHTLFLFLSLKIYNPPDPTLHITQKLLFDPTGILLNASKTLFCGWVWPLFAYWTRTTWTASRLASGTVRPQPRDQLVTTTTMARLWL